MDLLLHLVRVKIFNPNSKQVWLMICMHGVSHMSEQNQTDHITVVSCRHCIKLRTQMLYHALCIA